MLELKQIKKDYVAGDVTVHALKGIDIKFRESEFVSILGASGCGKTTLLNIVGGLDHATDGDLVIDGISTKKYKDRDWDTYRNHRIGFIFQSYNLIPHQTIIENVELALTIGGFAKKERLAKAKEALDKVGLEGLYKKKPNQLSGGQCQRVAIARALVNSPDILLADEPTGALDSVTSVQIMDLIAEIAKEKLVIMVTHNPDLAEKYSTRIIKLHDGEVVGDSNPFDGVEEKKEAVDYSKKSKLAFWQGFRLSSRNLRSKFSRTAMVCFAGSIGIVGVASVLGVSTGVQGYIDNMQNDMLSGNPVTIAETAYDLSSMMEAASSSTKKAAVESGLEDGKVNVDKVIDYLINQSDSMSSMIIQNEITADYFQFVKDMPKEYCAGWNYLYNLNLSNNVYTTTTLSPVSGETVGETINISMTALLKMYTYMLQQTEFSNYATLIDTYKTKFYQMPSDEKFVLSQYDIASSNAGKHLPDGKFDITLVLNDDDSISDLILAQLGYYTEDEFMNIIYKSLEDSRYNPSLDKESFDFSELLGRKFTWYPNNEVFTKNDDDSTKATYPFSYNPYASSSWTGGIELNVSAIITPKSGLKYGALSSGFYFNNSLVNDLLASTMNSEIVNYMNGEHATSITSVEMDVSGTKMFTGITYLYKTVVDGALSWHTGLIGDQSSLSSLVSVIGGSSINMPTYYTLSLRDVGGYDLPNSLKLYASDFESKAKMTEYLDKWNSDEDITVNGVILTKDDRSDVKYTDTLSIVIAMISTMIQIVTIALIAFTGLSLVVSTVMIAIITYVSVIERIKEIGVIRSLGGRKKDVSRLFNAETFIIGGISGIIGVVISWGICGIVNLIANAVSPGLGTVANLTPVAALIMVIISILLTSISGLIPASLAAKKDPVIALRTE